MKNTALYVSGTVFLVVAIFHLLRVIAKTSLVVGTCQVPLAPSAIGFVAALALAFWMFRAARFK